MFSHGLSHDYFFVGELTMLGRARVTCASPFSPLFQCLPAFMSFSVWLLCDRAHTCERSVDLASTLVYRARVTSTPTHVAALASRARMYSTNPCRQHILACGKVLQAPQDIPAGPAGTKKKKKKKMLSCLYRALVACVPFSSLLRRLVHVASIQPPAAT